MDKHFKKKLDYECRVLDVCSGSYKPFSMARKRGVGGSGARKEDVGQIKGPLRFIVWIKRCYCKSSRIKYMTTIVMHSFIHLNIYLLIQGSLIKHVFIVVDTGTIKMNKK